MAERGDAGMDLSWFKQVFQRDAPAVASAGREIELPDGGRVVVVRTISCMGENCPRPQLLTIKALSRVAEGEVVELVSDNPAAVESIPALMLVIYCTHVATVKEEGCWRVFMRKGM
jgi:tRNA 2-thiouridine synthesizing protein A